MKAPIIAALAAGTATLATAGYFANEWRVCRSLEQDVLDTAYSIKRDGLTDARLAAIGSSGPTRELAEARELQLKVFQLQLTFVYDRCGPEAGEEASKQVQDILYGPL